MAAFSGRTEFSMEYRLKRRDGEYRWILDTGRPYRQGDGTFAGFIGSCIDLGVHGTAIIGFCDLCQIVLCGGTSRANSACVATHDGENRIFCSEPCRWIFTSEPERYSSHKNLVKRVLAGEAPGNLMAMLTQYFGLTYDSWGKDSFGGVYPWLQRKREDNDGAPQYPDCSEARI